MVYFIFFLLSKFLIKKHTFCFCCFVSMSAVAMFRGKILSGFVDHLTVYLAICLCLCPNLESAISQKYLIKKFCKMSTFTWSQNKLIQF